MRSPPAIGFEYRPSRTLAVCGVAMITLALIAIALSGIAPWLQITCAFFALGYGAIALRRCLHPRVLALTWRSEGSVSMMLVENGGGRREVPGELRDARVFGPLIVLHLHWQERSRASLWLLPDNLDADTRRRLRVRLSTGGAQPASVNADSI